MNGEQLQPFAAKVHAAIAIRKAKRLADIKAAVERRRWVN